METRFKLRFKSKADMNAALAMESADSAPVVINEKRNYVSFTPSPQLLKETSEIDTLEMRTESAVSDIARNFGAEVLVDYQYELDASPDILVETAPDAEAGSLSDVTAMIRADRAWPTTRGAGVIIAIVDTGIDGRHNEFAGSKKVAGWAVPGDDPWTDYQGHGTMCGCIAAGTAALGGRYNGVAPDAQIMSCKTRFYDSELAAIYDTLTAMAKDGKQVVASNSFGMKTGSAPTPDPNSDFLPALGDAVAAGVTVIFSAGNNHQLAGGRPHACTPNSVWLHKSRSDVLAVATCKLDSSMWYYSSRGPGQHFNDPNTNRKPDITAPTPLNGKILYGSGERVLQNGWGTSGACPQVAGLAALILSVHPGVKGTVLFDRIRNSATSLGHGPECQGAGLINCEAALAVA